jgi:hypothetical protein
MKTNNEISGAQLEAAKAFERALSDKPVEEQLAVGLISKNVLNGCSWELCRMDPQIRRYEDAFKQSSTCSLQKITYNRQQGIKGYLVYMQMGRLLELLGPANKGPLIASDLEIAKKHREEAGLALIERLKSGYRGKIGIYCTNDTQSITISGKTFPAYSVTIKELCNFCQKTGYGIVIGGEPRDPQQVLQREDAVIESLLVAPSSNALLIDIAPMGKGR